MVVLAVNSKKVYSPVTGFVKVMVPLLTPSVYDTNLKMCVCQCEGVKDRRRGEGKGGGKGVPNGELFGAIGTDLSRVRSDDEGGGGGLLSDVHRHVEALGLVQPVVDLDDHDRRLLRRRLH